MKIFVAVPSRDNRITIPCFNSLLGECEAARRNGDGLEVSFLPGCSLLPHGRNELVQQFIESGADRLVFVDDDMSWEPGALCRLAHHDADIVGVAGRAKETEERYCVTWLDRPELWSDERGLIEVKSLGAAFLAISREAIERLRATENRTYVGDLDREVYAHFCVPFVDGRFFGEDAAFCRDWAAAGGTVWLDPELTLTHWDGNRPYKGHIGNWLKARSNP